MSVAIVSHDFSRVSAHVSFARIALACLVMFIATTPKKTSPIEATHSICQVAERFGILVFRGIEERRVDLGEGDVLFSLSSNSPVIRRWEKRQPVPPCQILEILTSVGMIFISAHQFCSKS